MIGADRFFGRRRKLSKWLRWGDMAEVLQGSWGSTESTGQVFETKLQIWAMFGDVSRFFES